jgi:hypothetical protein
VPSRHTNGFAWWLSLMTFSRQGEDEKVRTVAKMSFAECGFSPLYPPPNGCFGEP